MTMTRLLLALPLALLAACTTAYAPQPITAEIPRVPWLTADAVIVVSDERPARIGHGDNWGPEGLTEAEGALAQAIEATLRRALAPASGDARPPYRVHVSVLRHEVSHKVFYYQGFTLLRTVVEDARGRELARWDIEDRHSDIAVAYGAGPRVAAQRSLRDALRKLTRAMAEEPLPARALGRE